MCHIIPELRATTHEPERDEIGPHGLLLPVIQDHS